MQELYPQHKFVKCRPQWLRYKNNLELDFYCEELKLAVEYNGQQHYKFSKFFHGSFERFAEQKKRDEFKLKKCQEKGIKLIIVAYTEKNIKRFIAEQTDTTVCFPEEFSLLFR